MTRLLRRLFVVCLCAYSFPFLFLFVLNRVSSESHDCLFEFFVFSSVPRDCPFEVFDSVQKQTTYLVHGHGVHMDIIIDSTHSPIAKSINHLTHKHACMHAGLRQSSHSPIPE